MIFSDFKKLVLTLLLTAGLLVFSFPSPVQAQWPPFNYRLSATFAAGKISYAIHFSKKIEEPITDLVIKIPLPEGTRFLEAGSPDTTSVGFDGAEVTFFTPTLHRSIRGDAFFTVEVTNPDQSEFVTHSWLAWKGEMPGDYLTGETTIDITKTPLDWEKPTSRLRLEAGANVENDVVTYQLYPMNIGNGRMWDITIALPLPPGTTFLAAEPTAPFEAGFDGQQVFFNALELGRRDKVGPLLVKLSVPETNESFLRTQAWASWTNAGTGEYQQETTKTGDIVVQPGTRQQVVADAAGDTPFENYDLTTVAFEPEPERLKITMFTYGDMGPVGQPLEQYLYLDQDCNSETGKPRGNRGAEYWLRYRHQSGRAYLYTWNSDLQQWENRQRIPAFTAGGPAATIWLPWSQVSTPTSFCWLGVSRNRSQDYHPGPPVDWIGRDPRLTRIDSLALSTLSDGSQDRD